MGAGAWGAHSDIRRSLTGGQVGRFVGSLIENSEAEEGARPGAPLIRGDMAVVLFGGVHLFAN